MNLIFSAEIECPPPLPPLNGRVAEQRAYKVGAMVQYECDPGHVIMGQPILVCQSDGIWSAPPPYCEFQIYFLHLSFLQNPKT
jgi:hypothetical protein